MTEEQKPQELVLDEKKEEQPQEQKLNYDKKTNSRKIRMPRH